jgi:hypothetical protein
MGKPNPSRFVPRRQRSSHEFDAIAFKVIYFIVNKGFYFQARVLLYLPVLAVRRWLA